MGLIRTVCSAVLALLIMVVGANAQERRWVDWDGPELILEEQLVFIDGWMYQSPGMLPGEVMLVFVYRDNRANSPDDKLNLVGSTGVGVFAELDIASTFPGKTIVAPKDFGLCNDYQGQCTIYKSVVEPLEVGRAFAMREGYRVSEVSTFATCRNAIERKNNLVPAKPCMGDAISAVNMGGLARLSDFLDEADYPNGPRKELALRLIEDDNGSKVAVHITFPLEGLIQSLSEYQ